MVRTGGDGKWRISDFQAVEQLLPRPSKAGTAIGLGIAWILVGALVLWMTDKWGPSAKGCFVGTVLLLAGIVMLIVQLLLALGVF